MSYTSLLCHIAFATEERRPFLTPEVLPRVCQYVGGIARRLDCQLPAVNGTVDHVHLAAILHPTVAVAQLLGEVKSRSSTWIHKTWPESKPPLCTTEGQ